MTTLSGSDTFGLVSTRTISMTTSQSHGYCLGNLLDFSNITLFHDADKPNLKSGKADICLAKCRRTVRRNLYVHYGYGLKSGQAVSLKYNYSIVSIWYTTSRFHASLTIPALHNLPAKSSDQLISYLPALSCAATSELGISANIGR